MKIKSWFDFAVQKWWVIYGMSLVVFSSWILIALFGPPLPKSVDEFVFYPWIMMREKGNLLVVILLVCFVLGSILFALKNNSFGSGLFLAIITLISCIAILAWIGPYIGDSDPTLNHVDSTSANGHVYNLAKHNAFYEAIGQAYILYECDSLGINCRTIYRYKPKFLEEVYADKENSPFISSDSTGISVHIAGKVLYTVSTTPKN